MREGGDVFAGHQGIYILVTRPSVFALMFKALNKLIISQHEGMRCDDSYSMCISTSFNILFGYANLYRKALEMIVHEQGIDTMPLSLLVSVHVFTRFEVIFTPLSKTVWQDCISFVLWPLHELNTT